MKKNCLIALLLVMSLLMMLFAGCGTGTEGETGEPAASSVMEEAPSVEEPESLPLAELPSEGEQDSLVEESALEVEEVLPEITYPLTQEKETLSLYCTAANFMGPLSVVSMDWDDFDCYKALEELTNVHIDFEAVSFESYMNNYNIYIAAGDYADLIINVDSGYVGGVSAAHEEGVIVDLTPYLKDYAPDYYTMLESDVKLHEAAYNAEGRVLKFITTYDTPGVKNGGIVRGDWLEELGLEITDVDSLHEYLLAAKNQFGAENPVYMTTSANDFCSGWDIHKYTVGGGDLSFYVTDGEVKTPLNQEAYRDYLRTMHQWYEEGLIYQDFATTFFDPHGNALNQMIYNGEVAVWATMLEGLDDYKNNATDPNFISQPIPEVTLSGDTNHCTAVEYVISDSDICVSTNCENVELAVSWMNYWYTEEGIRMYNYGPEGKAYHLDGDKVVLEDFVLNNEYGVDVSSYLRICCPYGSFAGVYLRSRLTDYSSQLQLDAAEIWTASNDGAYIIPDGVTVDAEANERQSSLGADIMTYADTCVPKFIMGDMDIETEWDTYIENLNSMSIEECVQIEQEAYDAYMGG